MLLATIAVLTAAIARLPYVLPLGPPAFFGLTDLLVVAAMVYDWWTRGRVHPALLWGGLFLIASQPCAWPSAAPTRGSRWPPG